jgi:hypothetical protein
LHRQINLYLGYYKYLLFIYLINITSIKIIILLKCLTTIPTTGKLPFYFSYLSSIEAESALRRSRVAAELAASRVAADVALRRSRIEADIAADNALRRSRL